MYSLKHGSIYGPGQGSNESQIIENLSILLGCNENYSTLLKTGELQAITKHFQEQPYQLLYDNTILIDFNTFNLSKEQAVTITNYVIDHTLSTHVHNLAKSIINNNTDKALECIGIILAAPQ